MNTSKRILIYNHPEHDSITTGTKIEKSAKPLLAMKVANWRTNNLVLEAYDCGLPDTVENRKQAGIPVPTLEQIAAAEQEIAVALKERAEEQRAVKQEAADIATAKQQAINQKALKWNQEQADKGDSYGLFRMGERYRDGDGVEKNFSKAREYLERAVSAGSPAAKVELFKLSERFTDKLDP